MSPKALTRRVFIGGGLATAALMGGSSPSLGARPRIHVFFPVLESVRTMGLRLQEALPGALVTVFGRREDFAARARGAGPDALIAPALTLQTLGYAPLLRGHRGGREQERYTLLTRQGSSNPRLAVLDLVGRRELPDLVAEAFAQDVLPPLQRVLKVMDLLQTLQLDIAGAAMIPSSYAATLIERSRLDLRVGPLPRPVATRASIALSPHAPGELKSSLAALPSDIMEMLRVEGFR